MSAFANCGRAVAYVGGSYVPTPEVAPFEHFVALSAIASRFDCIDNRRIHIGGVNPSLPYVIRGVCRVPSDCFFAAAMKILVPGLRSLLSPVA
jgi:hypothetical protein